VSRIVEAVVPGRMGSAFRWLLASSWVSNIGDGIALAAGPLLVASQTSNPALVAGAGAATVAPQLLFGLYAGALADRVDRRRMTVLADLARIVVLGILVLTIVTGGVSIAAVITAMFLLGTGEVFADSASRTLLPMLVPRADLGIGNARLQAGYLTANQLIGPPIGAFIFAAGRSLPFVTQAVACLLGLLLIWRIGSQRPPAREEQTHLRRDIADGIRWLVAHGGVRTLTLVILLFNITWGAAWSILVLWALHRLDAGAVGYGLLTTATALGGLVATVGYDRLERQVRASTLMKACLVAEVLTHLALALTTTLWLALVIMFFFGLYAFVWGSLGSALRQRAVPDELQGRVGSVYVLGIYVGLVVGQGLGGFIATHWGLAAPFWFAFVGSALTLAALWRQLDHVVHAANAD
jgi:MFS family permease